jgi:hypothetical protein
MTRTIYVLRDSLVGLYYVDASISLGDFAGAVIHTTVSSARSGAKGRARTWKNRFRDTPDTKENRSRFPWVFEHFEDARKRQHLTHYGVIIESITVSNSNAEILPIK